MQRQCQHSNQRHLPVKEKEHYRNQRHRKELVNHSNAQTYQTLQKRHITDYI